MKISKLLCTTLCCLPMLPLHAQVLTAVPEISGYIRSGGEENTGVFGNTNFLVGDTGGGATRTLNGILQFDLSAIDSANRELVGASLVFTIHAQDTGSSNAPVTFDLWTLGREVGTSPTWTVAHGSAGGHWQVKGATGALDRSALVSSLEVAIRPLVAGDTITFTGGGLFLSEVQNALDGDGTLGFWLGLAPGEADTSRHIFNLATHRHATRSPHDYRPQLVLQFQAIPEPSTWAFLGAGGLLLLGLSRRGRRPVDAAKSPCS